MGRTEFMERLERKLNESLTNNDENTVKELEALLEEAKTIDFDEISPEDMLTLNKRLHNDDEDGCRNCGRQGHFMRECRDVII